MLLGSPVPPSSAKKCHVWSRVSGVREAILQALKIRPGEERKVLLMSTYLLLSVAAFICGRIARDSLFLSAFDKQYLAYMYISVAVRFAMRRCRSP